MDDEVGTLARAVAMATAAHDGQRDKAGAPYIEHPLRVMHAVDGTTAKIVAVLHDVVEDTDVTVRDLESAGFPSDVISAVDSLTKRSGESLDRAMARVARDPVARTVKIADIDDNSDPRRLALLPEETRDRLTEKYTRSRSLLNGSAPSEATPAKVER